MIDLAGLEQQVANDINVIDNLHDLETYRQQLFGKKGKITTALRLLGQLAAQERATLGQQVNTVKNNIQLLLKQRHEALLAQQVATALAAQTIDVTLPGRQRHSGSLHPITTVLQRLENICQAMGFVVATGPEIESDYYNFTALNIPPLHPARAMTDTFYLNNDYLLRTHTSPVQIRFLQQQQPPVRMLASGRVYRRDYDATHTPMFHQIEGLVLDTAVTFANLKGLITALLTAFFETEVRLRFRPSYFPFTEPSAEVDLACVHCHSKGCKVCGNSGWLEVLGCGMVHPNVCRMLQLDPEVYRGFAFGIGCERLALLYYNIPDLRLLFENDLRLLQQF